MKIYHSPHVAKAMKVYEKSRLNVSESTKELQQHKDQLELSEVAKDFQVALKAFRNLPEIREDKVNAIKEKMKQGTYQVSGKEVADKILEGIYINKKI